MTNLLKNIIALCLAIFILHPSRSGGSGFSLEKNDFAKKIPVYAFPYDIEVLPGIANNTGIVKAGLLYDVNQNKVVWEKGMFASYPIASLTKLMTVLLVMEDIGKEKMAWNTQITVTKEASLIASSKLWMKPGQVFALGDLVKSAMISSANDACYLLGQFCEGTEKAFVTRMNEKALSLGMFNSYFSNTTGLPAVSYAIDNFSSPHDLLILSRELMKFPEILSIACIDKDQIFSDNQKFELKNHNKLTIEYTEVDGLKTGYTRKAGFCIVATAQKSDTRLIGIVLGATSPLQRNDFVADIFNSYYNDILCFGKLCKSPLALATPAKKSSVAAKKKSPVVKKSSPTVKKPTSSKHK